MSRAIVISPNIFIEHATRIRARKLEQIAATLKAEGRLHPLPVIANTNSRRDLTTVLRQFRSRII